MTMSHFCISDNHKNCTGAYLLSSSIELPCSCPCHTVVRPGNISHACFEKRCEDCAGTTSFSLVVTACKCACHPALVSNPPEGSLHVHLLNDGRAATLYRLLFGYRILVGPADDHTGGDEIFEYRDEDGHLTPDEMITVLRNWDGFGFPKGWYRRIFKNPDQPIRRTRYEAITELLTVLDCPYYDNHGLMTSACEPCHNDPEACPFKQKMKLDECDKLEYLANRAGLTH